jgi:hypothetical protein
MSYPSNIDLDSLRFPFYTQIFAFGFISKKFFLLRNSTIPEK